MPVLVVTPLAEHITVYPVVAEPPEGAETLKETAPSDVFAELVIVVDPGAVAMNPPPPHAESSEPETTARLIAFNQFIGSPFNVLVVSVNVSLGFYNLSPSLNIAICN